MEILKKEMNNYFSNLVSKSRGGYGKPEGALKNQWIQRALASKTRFGTTLGQAFRAGLTSNYRKVNQKKYQQAKKNKAFWKDTGLKKWERVFAHPRKFNQAGREKAYYQYTKRGYTRNNVSDTEKRIRREVMKFKNANKLARR